MPLKVRGVNGGDSLCRVIGLFSIMFRWRGLDTHLARRWTYHPTSRRNIRRQLRFSGLGSLWVSVDIWSVVLVLVAVVLWWWLLNLAGIDLSARFILRKSGKRLLLIFMSGRENKSTGIPVYHYTCKWYTVYTFLTSSLPCNLDQEEFEPKRPRKRAAKEMTEKSKLCWCESGDVEELMAR